MLNVSYLKKYGYFTLKANDGKTWLRCDIHPANCLLATVYHYRQKNEETGKMEKYSQLVNFFNDLEHLRRCFKPSDPIYEASECREVVLYTNLPQFAKIAEIIAKAGLKVIIKPNPKKTK